MRDDSAEEHARVAEEAKRTAHEQAQAEQERARAISERAKSEASTGPTTQEVVGQRGLIYGGLILIGLYWVQPFLTAPSLDASAKVSIVAFAVAIPLLAALVMVNRQEAFRGRRTTSVTVTIAHAVALLAAFIGIVAELLAHHVDRRSDVPRCRARRGRNPLGWLLARRTAGQSDVLGDSTTKASSSPLDAL